jgi:8-oxo-dGTP diphosphatase
MGFRAGRRAQRRGPLDPPVALPARPLTPGRASGPLRFSDVAPEGRASGGAIVAYRQSGSLRVEPAERSTLGIILCTGTESSGPLPHGVPAIGGVDEDLLREEELLELDGTQGTWTIEGTREVEVVTVFLERSDGQILLLQRSELVGSFRGRWAAISGYLEDPSPMAQALREVHEETGVPEGELSLARAGEPVLSRDGREVYVVHPFRFRTKVTSIRLNWEHTAYEWVRATEIEHRPTVPKLGLAWSRVGESPYEKH